MNNDIVRDHEQRIQRLETNDAVMMVKIETLISSLNSLISWFKALFLAMLPAIGFLFYQVFKK